MPIRYDEDGWNLLDYFCGAGKVGTLAMKAGYQAALFDLNFEPAPTERSSSQRKSKRPARSKFDCNGEVGYSFPGHINLKYTSDLETLAQVGPAPSPSGLSEVDGAPGFAREMERASHDAGNHV